MSNAQPTGTFSPQMPTPSQKSQAMHSTSTPRNVAETAKASHQPRLGVLSMGAATISVSEWKSCPPRISGARPTTGSNETLSSAGIFYYGKLPGVNYKSIHAGSSRSSVGDWSLAGLSGTTESMFSGSLVPIITPFKGGKVDRDGLERVVEFVLAGDSDGVIPCGTTGESATLSHEEHEQVIRWTIEIVRKRVPVIAGTGSNSTGEAIGLTKSAEKAGADGALLISPYYNRPTQEGIFQHYKAIAEASRLPLIIYNIPGRTGSRIEPATLARLAKVPGVAGVKEATGSIDTTIDIIDQAGPGLAV